MYVSLNVEEMEKKATALTRKLFIARKELRKVFIFREDFFLIIENFCVILSVNFNFVAVNDR